MSYVKKIGLIFLALSSTSILVMDRPITEAERLRRIIHDDVRWHALSEAQQSQLLADLYIAEMEEEKQAESEKKSKEAIETKKREAEELARARKELEMAMAQERERKAEQALKAQEKRYKNLFETFLDEYLNDNTINIEYLSTQTLQNLLTFVKNIETDITAPLAQKYDKNWQEIYEFGVKPLSDAINNELKIRKESSGTDFKSLINKGLGKPPYHVDFETFKTLQNKLKSIDLLQKDETEKAIWAKELNVSPDQIRQALINIRGPLLVMNVNVKKQVVDDLQAIEKERQEEQQARDHILKVLRERKELNAYQLKIDEVRKTYPDFLSGIPHDLEIEFLKKFEELYGKPNQSMNQILTNLYYDVRQKPTALKNRLTALGTLLGYKPYALSGFVFFDNKDQRSQLPKMTLPELLSLSDRDPIALRKKVKEGAQQLVQVYKIHLMPDENTDVAEILVLLDKALKSDAELSSLVQTFKILVNSTKQGNTTFPRVVFYANGKDHAQKLLNALYHNRFIKQMKGSGMRPRFNAKVNDLLWVAQGDGDYKEGPYSDYYEQPLKTYYHSGITGKRENYHLIHPETRQEVVN